MEQNQSITGMSSHHRILAGSIKRNGDRYFQLTSENPSNTYQDEMDEITTTLVILVSTYTEALINIYLSIKLSEIDFKKLERSDAITKWEIYPRLLNPEYSLNDSLKECLGTLKTRRNKIIHFKPEVVIDGEVKTKGVPIKIPVNDTENVISWLQLPESLLLNLNKYDNSAIFFQYFHLSHVQVLHHFQELLSPLNKAAR